MAVDDLDYGLRLLAGAVARDTDGIAATDDGGRKARRRIVRALEALEAEGLAEVVRTGGRVAGAQLTLEGLARGRSLASRSPARARIPGDVLDVVVLRKGGLGEVE